MSSLFGEAATLDSYLCINENCPIAPRNADSLASAALTVWSYLAVAFVVGEFTESSSALHSTILKLLVPLHGIFICLNLKS